MPRYGYGSDSVDQYQGTPFDPLTGRLNGGQLVMQVINEMAARKKQKQQEGWEVEDRDWQKTQRELAKREAELGIAQQERAAKDYVSPQAKQKYDLAAQYLGSIAQNQQKLREIEAKKKADLEVVNAKPTKTKQELDKDYLGDVEAANKNYATLKATARIKRMEAYQGIYNNAWQFANDPEALEKAKSDVEGQYNDYIKWLDEQQGIEMNSIDERYSDLPRAQRSQKKRGTPEPAPAPVVAPPEVKTGGTKKRKDLPAGADVRVAPDGKRLVKIGGVIYEVID